MPQQTLAIVGVKNLGREIALHFARQGWRVRCASRTAADVEAVAEEVTKAGGVGEAVVCDLASPASLAPLANGGVDLVIASQTAGGRFGSKPLLEIEDRELQAGFDAYVRGTWNLLRAVGPTLLGQKHGTFLQIGTSSGVRTKDGFAVLGAVQHGLRALLQVAAREWRANGVHVAYLPIDGAIESAKTRGWMEKNGEARAVPPQAIAAACAFLHEQGSRGYTHELVLRPLGTDWTAPT